jgi:NAD(P)H-dependent FMN reductase
MDTVHITTLLGTARRERKSEHVAKFVHNQLQAKDIVTSEFVDVREFAYSATVPPWDESGAGDVRARWKEVIERSDGLIIVTPEYNHGYPGELKLLLDSLYDEYRGIPTALCGVSDGRLGGARVVENLKPVLTELKMIIVPLSLYIAKVDEVFAKDGALLDESVVGPTEKVLDMLIKYTQALKNINLG